MKVSFRCSLGGVDPKEERIAYLNGGIHVAVGTPGRIKHLIDKKILKTEHLKIVILEEADEILCKGFTE